MSLVERRPHIPSWARSVLDFILSDAGQAIWTNAYLQPARPVELPAEVAEKLPAGIEDYARAKARSTTPKWSRCRRAFGERLSEPRSSNGRSRSRGRARFARPDGQIGVAAMSQCHFPRPAKPRCRWRSFTLAFAGPAAGVGLMLASGEGPELDGRSIARALANAALPFEALWLTVVVSLAVTAAALAISTTAGLYLVPATRFFGSAGALLASLTVPLAFPGVVVGFLIILLGGRQGLVNQLMPGRVVFAYSPFGLVPGLSVLLDPAGAADGDGGGSRRLDPALGGGRAHAGRAAAWHRAGRRAAAGAGAGADRRRRHRLRHRHGRLRHRLHAWRPTSTSWRWSSTPSSPCQANIAAAAALSIVLGAGDLGAAAGRALVFRARPWRQGG